MQQPDDLTHSGARGYDIVDNQHLAAQRRANERAALSMVLGLLAIISEWHIAPMMVSQGYGRGCSQWDAFVGGAQQKIKAQSLVDNALRTLVAIWKLL